MARTTRPTMAKARRATFVFAVVTAVPVQVEWPVVEIDDVDGGHAKFEKRYVIVLDGPRTVQEVSTVAKALGLCEHDIGQPGG